MREKLMQVLSRPLWAMLPMGFHALVEHAQGMTASRPAVTAEALFAKASAQQPGRATVIPVFDVLTRDNSWAGTTYEAITSALETARADKSVKEVILYIDSPGGEVTGLPETAAAISQLSQEKPVTALVPGIAASAAYWLASQASRIVLTPSGEVGSVGVRMMHADLSKMLADMGVKITEMSAGDFKTEFTPFSPLTAEAKASAQSQLDELYGQFLRGVSSGRRGAATPATVAGRFGNGRMLQAKQALAAGMVDAIRSPREFLKTFSPGGVVQRSALAATKAPDELNAASNSATTFRARLEIERMRSL